MNLTDFAIIGIVAVILISVIVYIIKAKKSGAKCIGCPYSKNCNSKSSCSCNKEK